MKKFLGIFLSATMILSQLAVPVMAKGDGGSSQAWTAEVFIQAQSGGAYLAAPATKIVSSSLAEDYGYTDQITDGVSALDALVAESIVIFGEEDFEASPETYLKISNSGWIQTIFGIETSAAGFTVNGEITTTVINQTRLSDNDSINFYTYSDTDMWLDKATLFTDKTPIIGYTGVENTVTLKYTTCYGPQTYVLEDASIGTVDMQTGSVKEISGVTTDEDGKAKITFNNPGTYYITACGTDDADVPLVMNAAKVIINDNATAQSLKQINTDVYVQAQAGGEYLTAPKTVSVNAFLAESYGYEDTVTTAASTLDALVAESIAIYGKEAFDAEPTKYLAVSGGWITTMFASKGAATGFYVNDKVTTTLVNETPLASNDNVNFFTYVDDIYYKDLYVTFAKDTPKEAETNKAISVTVSGTGYNDSWDTVTIPVEGAKIGIVNTITGKITEINGAVTDKNGKAEVKFDTAGTYYITAYGKDSKGVQLIMNPVAIKVTKVEEKKEEPTTLNIANGATFTANGNKYKVTSNAKSNPTVTVTGPKNKKSTKITVPANVTINGESLKVTAIANGAYKGMKKLKTAVVGKNIKTIGSQAFAGDSNLKKVVVNSTVLTKVGAKAFSGINKKAKIKVPAKQLNTYKKLFKNKGQKKSVKITK